MTMLEHIRNLFSYDDWANREVLSSLQALDVPPARSINLLAHIVSAERLWLERLLVQNQTLPVWPQFTLKRGKLEVDQLPLGEFPRVERYLKELRLRPSYRAISPRTKVAEASELR